MPNRNYSVKRNTGVCTDCGCGAYLTEFAEEFSAIGNNSVRVSEEGGMVRVNYDGLLAQSGAEHVYAAVSYGDNSRWEDTNYHRMERSGQNRFEVLIPKSESRQVNIAFKDCANNWDNNSGHNYSFTMH